MDPQTLEQLKKDQAEMSRQAIRVFIIISAIGHALLNGYAWIVSDSILRIVMPVATLVTALLIILILYPNKKVKKQHIK